MFQNMKQFHSRAACQFPALQRVFLEGISLVSQCLYSYKKPSTPLLHRLFLHAQFLGNNFLMILEYRGG